MLLRIALVALKHAPRMHCALQADFKEEMAFMAALVRIGGHRNIVGVVGFVQNANQPLLLLEYCAFGSLKTVLVELNRCLVGSPTALPPTNQLLAFAHDVAMAMAFLAQHKLVRVPPCD